MSEQPVASEPTTAGSDPHALPRRTTPTWEMELLISGALVFSLLQLPALLDAWLLRWMPVATDDFRGPLAAISMYLRTALMALTVAFVVHLIVRAHWVALVGVHSVFPGGPRWEALFRGRFQREVSRAQHRPITQRIEAMDNLASVVFALGVALVLMMLGLTVTAGGMFLLSGLLSHIGLFGWSGLVWTMWLIGLLVGPRVIASLIDRVMGERLDPQHWPARAIRWTLSQRWMLPGVQSANEVIQPLLSNIGARGANTWFGLLVAAVLVLAALTMPTLSEQLRLRILAPRKATAQALLPVHYRDERRGFAVLSMLPSIASRELGDKPLQLFVPLRANRHPQALRAACPDVAGAPPKPQEDADPAVVEAQRSDWDARQLACAHRLFAPTLDGQPWPGSAGSPVFADDPRSGFEGLWWRLDNAAIPAGRHVLRVEDPMPPQPDAPARAPIVIVFWR